MQPPTDNQIQHIINSVKIDNNKNCTLNELKKWCEDRSTIPEDEDQVFVGKFEYLALPKQEFRIFLTTKRLIKFAEKSEHVLSDATYKLTYENFPIITGGTTDRNKHLHPIGIAITRHETEEDFGFFFSSIKETYERVYQKPINFTSLIADNAAAIHNGFKRVFDLKLRVNCWAHVYRNIQTHMKSFSKLQMTRILDDIKQIQKIFDENLFPTAIKLFQEKWEKVTSSSIKSFLDYFKDQWCQEGHNGWFEGYAHGLPSTSNGLESINDKIKTAIDNKRFGLIPFLNECCENILKEWTKDRSPTLTLNDPITNEVKSVQNLNQKIFNDFPSIEKSDLVEA
ncbi:unnamed protein product, partial [Brachionus calyciflorus]